MHLVISGACKVHVACSRPPDITDYVSTEDCVAPIAPCSVDQGCPVLCSQTDLSASAANVPIYYWGLQSQSVYLRGMTDVAGIVEPPQEVLYTV